MDKNIILETWGNNFFNYVDLDRFENLDEKSRALLENIGLPKSEILLLKFRKNLIRLSDEYNSGEIDDYILIGYEDERDFICLDNKNQVVLVEKESGISRFINSGVFEFINCITEYKIFIDRRVHFDESEYNDNSQKYAIELEEKLTTIDKNIKTAEYFWPVILEQIEFGMI